MTTQDIYIVEGYFRSPGGTYSFHPGETLNRDEMVQRGMLVPASDADPTLVPSEAMKTALWRGNLRRQEEAAAADAPGNVMQLLSADPDPGPAPELRDHE